MKKFIAMHDAMLAISKKVHLFLMILALIACATFYYLPVIPSLVIFISWIGLLLFMGYGMAMNIFIKRLAQQSMYRTDKPLYNAIPAIVVLGLILSIISVVTYLLSTPENLMSNLAQIWLYIPGMTIIVIILFSIFFLLLLRIKFAYLDKPEKNYKDDLIWLSTYMDVANFDEEQRLYIYNQIEDTNESSSPVRTSFANGSCSLARQVKKILDKKAP